MGARLRSEERFPSVAYFAEDGRQIKPLPRKWMSANRFKVGDKIEWLDNDTVHFGCDECKAKDYFHYGNASRERCEDRPMRGLIGVVTETRDGYGTYPGRWIADESYDEGGFYDSEHTGCLFVQFPFSPYRKADGSFGGIACHLDGEGRYWRRAK